MSDSCLEELACSEDARNLSDSVVGSSNAMSGSREILQKGNADCFGSCDSKATSSEKKDGLVDVCGDVATLSLEKIESFMGERCSLNEDRSEPAAPEGLCSEKEWYPGEIVPENVCRGEEMGFKLSPHNNLLFKSVQQMEQEDDIGGDTSCGEGVEVKEIADVDHQGGGDCGEENQSSQMLYQEIQGCGSSGGMIEKMKHSDFNPINGLGLETHIDVAGSTDSVMGRVDIDTSKRLALEGGESVERLVCVAAGNSHVQSEEMDDDTVCDHPEKRVEVGKMKHSMGECNDVKTRNCQMPLNESRKADFACNIDHKAEQETFDTSRVCLPRIVSSIGKIDGMDGEEDDSYKERVSLVHCAVESEEATGIGDNFASVNQIDTCSLCKKSSDLSGEESDDLARGEVDTFNRILCSEAGKVPSESEAGSLNHLDPTNDQGVNSTVTVFSSETRVEEKTAAETACFQLLHSKDFPATLEQSCSFTENRQEESTSDCGPSSKDVLEYREQNVDCLGWVEADLCNQISASRVSGMPCERELLGMSLFCEREDAGVVGRPETIDYTSAKINNVSGAFTRDDIKLTEEKCIVSYDGDLCLDRNPNSSGEEVPEIVSPSSQKSSRISKSGRKTQAKRAARNSRNASKVIRPLEAREFVAEAARRKRTSLSKAARASPWGAFPNVSQLFEQMNGLGFGKIKSKRRSKARSGQESNTKDKNQQNGNPQVSDGKGHGSFTRIRLKVKLGKGPGQSSVNIMEVVKSGPSEVSKLQINVGDDLKGKEKSFECLSKNSSYMATENSETCLILEKSSGNVEDYLEIPSQVEIDAVGRTAEGSYLYPETSPDSEVINIVPDSQVGERHRESSGGVVLPSSPEFAACKSLDTSKRGKKKDRIPRRVNHAQKDGSSDSGCVHKDKTSKKRGYKQNLSKGLMPKENLTTSAIGLSNDTQGLPLPKELDQGVSGASLQQEHADFPEQDVSLQLSESENSNKLLSSSKGKGCKVSQTAKSSQVYKQGPKGSNAARSRKANVRGQKENPQSTHSRSKVKNESIHDHVPSQVESPMEAGSGVADEQGLGTTLGDPTLPPCNAWVRCDDCHKWRRIPAALADSIEDTNSNWTCKDNMDKNYADCSIPQEKSNADINAELDISDASCEEDNEDTRVTYKELGSSRLTGPQQSSFVRIDSNKFLHRARRTQTIDEIMVCHCKPPLNGKLGCGDECLNRMLNIECVQGTCPCGDLCSNQQFQKRKYAQMQWFRCGKKGYGLQVLEDVSKGGFIIEYVGEVLDMPAYKARQREYASKGHKHFYFMTLNGNEVIDACAKGNLGRFINHSCDPNCRTEKWMVNGEICIGLFAVRDIKEGEELTFDYNYVRVFGAAAKKCVCGSPQCRGYLGGDPLNTEVIVQGDSDDEYPEPVMLHEDGDILPLMDSVVSRPSSFDDIGTLAAEARAEMNKSMDRSAADVRQLGSSIENEDQKAEVHSSDKLVEIIPLSAARQEIVVEGVSNDSEKSEIFSPLKPLDKLLPDDASRSRTQKSETIDKKSYAKLHPHVKTSRSGSIKKSKDKSSSIVAEKALGIANKSQMVAIKPKKAVEGSLSGRFEAVEEKLNELLDTDGGISKRKDAPKGYLKLLFLTAASGGRGCEAIQSNRDLSMILDALLKTRSRVVLVDIISKNGLQMLHNIMKQYRRDFKKIPILRKLLKVLEYLAVREVLTLEHIASGPPCLGMESFRESILSLTEHEDKQVHQIARNFRDKWIPKSIRKLGFGDRTSAMHNNWPEQSGWPVEAIDCGKQSMHTTGTAVSASQENGRTSCAEDRPASDKRVRKRKSRWDQDAEPIPQLELPLQEHQVSTGKSDCPGSAPEHSLVGTVSTDGSQHNSCEDVPPGFASTPDASQVPSHASSAAVDVSHEKVHLAECPFGAVAGHPQERFVSRLPVSYGIPLYFLQHLGKPNVESMESWTIAPGVPFHPFPPLPHSPRERKRRSPSETIDSQADSHPADSVHLEESSQASVIDESSPGTSNAVVDSEGTCANNQQMFKRMKVSSQDLGRRYFRQQKWNNTKLRPPWIRKRNCWRYPVNNSKGGMSSVGLGNGVHCQKNSSLSGEFNCKLGKEDNNYR